jgi:sulfite dehydrogenase (cytochrome) subunit B
MNTILKTGVALAAGVLAVAASGDETQVKLTDAPGAELVRTHCSVCHSVDYVEMNSPFLKRAGWEAEVRKMIKVMGAPIPEAQVSPIVDYLARHYGVE